MNQDSVQYWKKLGQIFHPKSQETPDWMHSHSAVPFLDSTQVSNSEITIYFSTRSPQNKSLPAHATFDLDNLEEGPLYVGANPLFWPGGAGSFDEDGVMGCHILDIGEDRYFYYIGWNLATSVPFKNSIGLAKWNHEIGAYEKPFKGPVVDRSIYDPCFVASNCVFAEDDFYRMYYLSCDEWMKTEHGFSHRYNIKYAESKDGIHWQKEGKIAIDYTYENEYAISVPRVIKENEIYKMWYSYRGGPVSEYYQIGYAESNDGVNWERKDELLKFEGEAQNWDADMMCYPYIFDYKDKRYMLYNGNGYGETGFGLAVLENK